MTKIIVFDGGDSIGGNKIYLQSGEKGVFLDFGTNYKRMGRFYEEYLKPRSSRGLYDFLELGLVPFLRIYRPDAIPSDLDIGRLRKCRVDGIFLTHAHMDHAGCIGLLNMEIPVICSPYTAAILKAIQDSGRTELSNQIAYTAPKEPLPEDSRVLKSADWKRNPCLGRRFLLTSNPSSELQDFWSVIPGSRKLQSRPLGVAGGEILPFKAWEVDHSIYGATAFGFEVEEGWVVYTGDFRIHGARWKQTRRFIREVANLDVAALIIEGTRTGRSEEGGSESEEEVFKNSLAVVEKEKGLVIADFQPRHVERLETFIKIAKERGRSLVVTARDAYLLSALKTVDGVDRMKDVLVYRELRENKSGWEKQVNQHFRDRMVDPKEIAKNPEAYILSFSFWDIKNLLDIGVKNGTYLYSSSEAFNEEMEFDFVRLWEWLTLFRFRVVGFEMGVEGGKPKPFFQHGYHASGHASADDLLETVETIGARVVIPVHTENHDFFSERVRSGRVVVSKKSGQVIDLSRM